jgi:hypothetical protein
MNDLDGMNTIAWIAAEAEGPEEVEESLPALGREGKGAPSIELSVQGLVAHQFPARVVTHEGAEVPPFAEDAKGGAASALVEPSLVEPSLVEPSLVEPLADECSIPELLETAAEAQDRTFHEDRERRVYRARTVQMLRRYLRYSIETGRLPSVLGGEFFRAKMTTYSVGTFEDRVIFVHDMEKCLGKLDEFSRQLIARHVLQEHDRWATARLLHCNEKTVRRYTPVVLDVLCEILLEVGLLDRLKSVPKDLPPNSCQGGKNGPFDASDCDDGKYNF